MGGDRGECYTSGGLAAEDQEAEAWVVKGNVEGNWTRMDEDMHSWDRLVA